MVINTRLSILSDDEINELYGIPKLEQDEMSIAFSLSDQEESYIETLSTIPIKIDFIIQLGFFKVTRNFYQISFQKLRDDVWFIINLHFPKEKFPKMNINVHQHYANQKAILALHGYKKSNTKFVMTPKIQTNGMWT